MEQQHHTLNPTTKGQQRVLSQDPTVCLAILLPPNKIREAIVVVHRPDRPLQTPALISQPH